MYYYGKHNSLIHLSHLYLLSALLFNGRLKHVMHKFHSIFKTVYMNGKMLAENALNKWNPRCYCEKGESGLLIFTTLKISFVNLSPGWL